MSSPSLIVFACCVALLAITHPVSSRVDRVRPDEKQRGLLHETFKNLLKIDDLSYADDGDRPPPPRPMTKSARAASKYMRRLFDRYRKHGISDSGSEPDKETIVRAITPKPGHFQNRQALIFELQSISSTESLIRAEIHYYLGAHASSRDQSSPKIQCYALAPSSSANGKPIQKTDLELPSAHPDSQAESRNWAVFDASQFLNSTLLQPRAGQAGANNDTRALSGRPLTVAVLFAKSSGSDGSRLRFSPLRKVLRFHAPFLSVSSRDTAGLSISDAVDDQLEDEEDEDAMEGEANDQADELSRVRKKRNVDANHKYYEYYHPYDTPYTTSPNDVGFNWRSISGQEQETTTPDFVQRGPSVLRRTGQSSKTGRRNHRKHNRRGSFGRPHRGEYLDDGNGAWSPLEHEEPGWGNNRKKKRGKVLKAKDSDNNPTTVVLLAGERDESANAMTCQRNDLVVDFQDIGWGDYVIAPSSFDAHYCAGSCPFPVPATVNATNHAIVLDIIQKIRLHPRIPKACCAPEKMDSLSLLYYDANGNVVLTTYPKMSVVSCACL